jgi:choline dehydrogenase
VSIDLPSRGPTEHRAQYQLVATLDSSLADPAEDPPDLQVVVGGPFGSDQAAVFFVGAALLKPWSRGQVGDEVRLGYFQTAGDLDRLLEGLDVAEAAITQPALRELTGGERLSPLIDDRDERRSWVRAHAWSYHHPVGTCAMGTVLDERCRVDGVEGLGVVDTSAMPAIPSANTHVPTTMLADHVAPTWLG